MEHIVAVLDTYNSPSSVVAIIGIIVGSAATFLIYLLQQRGSRKVLSYTHRSSALTKADHPFLGDLKITYRDQELTDLSVVNFTVRNSGRAPILKTDFTGNLLISLSEGGKTVAASLGDNDPHELPIRLEPLLRNDGTVSSEYIEVCPLLLNPGDEFTLSFLVSKVIRTPVLTGRIVGIQKFKRYEAKAEYDGVIQITLKALFQWLGLLFFAIALYQVIRLLHLRLR